MESIIKDIDSLILEIYQDIDLEKKEREEADKVVENIISLYSYNEYSSKQKEDKSKRTSWWSLSKTNKQKKNRNLYILT